MIWWKHDIFFIWEHSEESLKVFIDQVNIFHPTIMKPYYSSMLPWRYSTTEFSKQEVDILDLNIELIDVELRTDCLLNLQILISFYIQLLPILINAKKEYFKALRLNGICSKN